MRLPAILVIRRWSPMSSVLVPRRLALGVAFGVLALLWLLVAVWQADPPADAASFRVAADGLKRLDSPPLGGQTWRAGLFGGELVREVTPSGDGGRWSSLVVQGPGGQEMVIQGKAGVLDLSTFPLAVGATALGLLLAIAVVPLAAWWSLAIAMALLYDSGLVVGADPPLSIMLELLPALLGSLLLAGRRTVGRGLVWAGLVGIALVIAYVDMWLRPMAVTMTRVDTIAFGGLVLPLAGLTLVRWRGALAAARTRAGLIGETRSLVVLRGALDELLPGRAVARHLAAAHERTELAVALHSRIMPRLTALAATTEGPASESMADLLDEVRELINERHSYLVEMVGLTEAIEWLIERPSSPHRRLTVDLDDLSPDGLPPPPPAVSAAAFRVAQEAMINAARAGADHLTIRLKASAERVELVIADDGPGLMHGVAEAAAKRGHVGVLIMRDAADSVGANLDLDGSSGVGTTVTFSWAAT